MSKVFAVGDIVNDSSGRGGIILEINNNCTKSIIMWLESDLDFWHTEPKVCKIRAALNMDKFNVAHER